MILSIHLFHSSAKRLLLQLTSCLRWRHVDVQATEVYDYASRLASAAGVTGVHFHRAKFAYALRLAECGGFATQAFRYCQDVANYLWVEPLTLLDVCDQASKSVWISGFSKL